MTSSRPGKKASTLKDSELEITRDFAETMIKTLREPFLILDNKLRIIKASKSFYNTFNLTPNETENKVIYEAGNKQWDIPLLRTLLEKMLLDQIAIDDFVLVNDFSLLGPRTMILNARTLEQGSKKNLIILLAIEDITEQTKAKEAVKHSERLEILNTTLKRRHGELLALNRSKDEFISLASHQLRTPATGVKQYVGMLLEGYAGDVTADQREFLDQAYQSNERQLRIVDDLLKVARVDSGKMALDIEPVDLVSVIDGVLDEQASQFVERDQDVKFEHTEPKVIVDLDGGRIRMVLENLVDNASKYTHHGKKITVSLSRDADGVRIAIMDEGVGIDEKHMSRLFQKFSRLDNDLSVLVGGTGLGLYWAKKVVDMHHGSISVESTPGGGSTFTVSIPSKDQKIIKKS